MRTKLCRAGLAVFLFIAGGVFVQDAASDDTLSVSVIEGFEPGFGPPIGTVILAQGDALVVHRDTAVAYRLASGIPLFEEDIIRTLEKGRVRYKLEGEILMTLSSNTKIVLNRALFDPEKQEQSSFVNMLSGKARFVVKKLIGFKQSEFKVKTKTCVLGVRGSDFIVSATDTSTQVSALEGTTIEIKNLVVSQDKPEPEIIVLKDFEQVVVDTEGKFSQIMPIFQDEIDLMKEGFSFPAESPAIPSEALESARMAAAPSEAPSGTGSETGSKTGSAVSTPAAVQPEPVPDGGTPGTEPEKAARLTPLTPSPQSASPQSASPQAAVAVVSPGPAETVTPVAAEAIQLLIPEKALVRPDDLTTGQGIMASGTAQPEIPRQYEGRMDKVQMAPQMEDMQVQIREDRQILELPPPPEP
jgi:hypothetical protein